MPPFGLAAAAGVLPIEARGHSAAERLGRWSKTPAASKNPQNPQPAVTPEVRAAFTAFATE
ncbi:hypothetical protein [Streptomyces sp. MBT27]|uniref:hypothetical protein n=1 Tax=Streptomyces sp. MBT27 TaxID=1488356 RepID=UPI001F0828A2|nr:hypothetical protein [Streptomyces sp. MBT27]